MRLEKLINLRIANKPPEDAINLVRLICHFARPRSVQRGLYSSVRPNPPESLLLTVGKIKKLVGEENVGIPALFDQRLPRAFSLDAGKLPSGKEAGELIEPLPILAFNYFDPPLLAETTIRNGALIYLRTPYFKGRVIEYGGVVERIVAVVESAFLANKFLGRRTSKPQHLPPVQTGR